VTCQTQPRMRIAARLLRDVYVRGEDGRLYVRANSFMRDLVVLLDRVVHVYFEGDDRGYLDINRAMKWCTRMRRFSVHPQSIARYTQLIVRFTEAKKKYGVDRVQEPETLAKHLPRYNTRNFEVTEF